MTQKKTPELHALMEPATAKRIAFGVQLRPKAEFPYRSARFARESPERLPRCAAAFAAADEKSDHAGAKAGSRPSAGDGGAGVLAVRHPC